MRFKNHALIGGGTLLGAALILTLGVPRADDRTVTEIPEPRQMAANTATDNQGPGIPMEKVIRRMEEKYNGRVTGIELEREWSGDVYETEIQTAEGYEWEVEVDAESGEILEEKRERDD